MTAIPKPKDNNVIKLTLVDGKLCKKPDIKYNKDGSINKTHNNKVAGISSEVYAFTSEEIKSMIKLFNQRIENALDEGKRQIACRNKMLFIIGVNIGLRASDLTNLKWNFFLNENKTFKDFYKLQTKKTGKFVPLHFNNAVKKVILDYIKDYPIEDLNDYLFKSRKGNGSITEKALWNILNEAATELGIEKNIGSHSLRKTFGYFAFHNADDKNKALVTLQVIFNHSSTTVTARYIGLTNGEVGDIFNSLDLGLDYM